MPRSKALRETVFIVGAGISVDSPSCIPPAQPVIELLCRWIAGGDRGLMDFMIQRCRPRTDHNPFQFVRFEALIGAVEEFVPGVASALRSLETHGLPNAHHHFLAAAAAAGATVVTTNFDTRIEMAADWNEVVVNCHVTAVRNVAPSPEHALVKVHGTFPVNGRRGVRPKATLRSIGAIGLGFSHHPSFIDWFRRRTADATVHVLGYSASDSFDVVPLLEEHCQAKRIEWFEYVPTAKRMRSSLIRRGDSAPIPDRPGQDFVDMTLRRFRGLHPATEVVRTRGRSLAGYMEARFGDAYQRYHELVHNSSPSTSPIGSQAIQQNLSELESVLCQSPPERQERDWVLQRLYEDGAFGEGMTRSLEENTVKLPVKLQGTRNKAVSSKRAELAEAKFRRLLDGGHVEQAFLAGREWLACAGLADNPELQLMLTESEFNTCRDHRDFAGMKRARQRTQRQARKRGGVIWALVLVHRMRATESDLQFMKGVGQARNDPDFRTTALNHALSAIYYSFRTGRADWFVPGVWTAAALQETLGLQREGIELHRRLLNWLPARDIENRGVTLANLVSLALSLGWRRTASCYLEQLKRLSFRKWPIGRVFVCLSQADYERARRQFRQSLNWLNRAERLIRSRYANDPWSQLPTIGQMRSANLRRLGGDGDCTFDDRLDQEN